MYNSGIVCHYCYFHSSSFVILLISEITSQKYSTNKMRYDMLIFSDVINLICSRQVSLRYCKPKVLQTKDLTLLQTPVWSQSSEWWYASVAAALSDVLNSYISRSFCMSGTLLQCLRRFKTDFLCERE